MERNDIELSRALTNMNIKQKTLRARKLQIANLFDIYCSDIRVWAQNLARQVKEQKRIGLHPFMVADAYEGKKDKAVAILMSALIPLRQKGLLKRIDLMQELLREQPWSFLQGAYRIVDYLKFYKGLGCEKGALQKWIAILVKVFRSPENMWVSNLYYYIKTDEFHITKDIEESLSEAVFWLSESVLDVNKESIAVPDIKPVRTFLKAFVPRTKIITREEAVDMFKFEYPAMVWYAAMGREEMYQTNYDGIWRMEHNLQSKFKNGTQMDAYERCRFRRDFIKKAVLKNGKDFTAPPVPSVV